MDIGVSDIDKWHKEKGYNSCGYHYIIRRSGQIETGRKEDEIGAHTKGNNSISIGVCLVGGVDNDNVTPIDNFTKNQFISLKNLLNDILSRYPNAIVKGHRDFNKNKACPSFDVSLWWEMVNSQNRHFDENLKEERKFT